MGKDCIEYALSSSVYLLVWRANSRLYSRPVRLGRAVPGIRYIRHNFSYISGSVERNKLSVTADSIIFNTCTEIYKYLIY